LTEGFKLSDLSGIGYLAALVFLFAIFVAFVKDIINLSRKNKKQTKTSVSKPINGDKEDRKLNREDLEGDGLFFGNPLFPPEFEED
jgi:hypothetical protein